MYIIDDFASLRYLESSIDLFALNDSLELLVDSTDDDEDDDENDESDEKNRESCLLVIIFDSKNCELLDKMKTSSICFWLCWLKLLLISSSCRWREYRVHASIKAFAIDTSIWEQLLTKNWRNKRTYLLLYWIECKACDISMMSVICDCKLTNCIKFDLQ